MKVRYYDIGLNLFCKQFQEPEQVIADAKDSGVCCILTGTDPKENRRINDFVKTHEVFGVLLHNPSSQTPPGLRRATAPVSFLPQALKYNSTCLMHLLAATNRK